MNPRIALAALLPALVFSLAAGKALLQRQSGDEYTLLIGGYDPRDPLRGHYLRYRYEIAGDAQDDACGDEPCCYCVSAQTDAQPLVPVSCQDPPLCAALVDPAEATGPKRYYIPEEGRRDLEQRVRDAAREDRAAVRVGIEGGRIHVRALLIDGEPAL